MDCKTTAFFNQMETLRSRQKIFSLKHFKRFQVNPFKIEHNNQEGEKNKVVIAHLSSCNEIGEMLRKPLEKGEIRVNLGWSTVHCHWSSKRGLNKRNNHTNLVVHFFSTRTNCNGYGRFNNKNKTNSLNN